MSKKKIIWLCVAAAVLVAVGIWAFLGSSSNMKVTFVTQPVTRGDVSLSITATGAIEAVTEVEVGTQVSGIIDHIYVDYNSVVTKGQLIAEMDRITLTNDLQSAQASYDGAKAQYEYQEKLYNRNKTLHEKQLISDTDYEQSEYDYLNAKSNLDNSQASLAKAKQNLSYATITSPIDGVVINKAVEEGQTVASGYSTPTLFNIAADLKQMQVIADVDEADIGGIEEGQRATFTVDAYPDETFEGTVVQVRLGEPDDASSSVVTYEVVINAPNDDLKLKPRLTANVTIYKQEKHNVVVVPNRALRFTPTKAIAPGAVINDVDSKDKVWTKNGNTFTAIAVQTGLSGTSVTEVSGIDEGTVIVVESKTVSTEEENEPGFGPRGGGPGGPGGPF